jgi:endonuclease YncB( thermonuclease family)
MIRALAACALVLALVIPAAATEARWVLTGSASVSDGDTIEIGDDIVRLFGIDAAELSQSCSTKGETRWRCGTQARNRLIEIIDGRDVRCVGDQRDDYGGCSRAAPSKVARSTSAARLSWREWPGPFGATATST